MKALFSRHGQLKLAFNSLARVSGFCLAVIATLSITLTALFVVLSVVNTYFFKPLPVLEENRLAVVEQTMSSDAGSYPGFQSYHTLVHWYKNSNSLEMPVLVNANEIIFTGLAGEPREHVLYVSGNYFNLLKVPMLLGSGFNADDPLGTPDASLVLSEKFWREQLAADPDIVGKQLALYDRHFVVRGVVSSRFSPPYMFKKGRVGVWMPMGEDRRFFNNDSWQSPWDDTYKDLKLLALLKPGVTLDDARRELKQKIDEIKDQWLGTGSIRDLSPLVNSYRSIELGDKDQLSLLMLAGVFGLLLIALVNVGNLFLSRAIAQHKILALQAVLGAKRKTLFAGLLAQSGLLVAASVALALFFSAWGIRLFKHLASGHLPLVERVGVDVNLVLAAVAVACVLAYLFAFVSTRMLNFKTLRSQLQGSGKGSVGQLSGRAVKLLISVQMMLASVLVIFAVSVLGKSLETMLRPLGAEVENFYTARVFMFDDNSGLPERADRRQRLLETISAEPWIKQIAVGVSAVSERQTSNSLTYLDGTSTPFFPSNWIGPDYLRISGLKLLAGREFNDQAYVGKNELLVSISAAKTLKEDGDVLGMVVKGLSDEEYEIVGITEDFNHPKFYGEDKGRHIWWPDRPYSYGFTFEVAPGKTPTQAEFLQLARKVDSRMAAWEFYSLEKELDAILYLDRLTLVISLVLAGFTLLLASIGIYGVLSYNLAFKRFEFGLRMALGATRRRMYGLATRQALVPIFIGLAVAIMLCAVCGYVWRDSVAAWLKFDPLLLGGAMSVALAVALFAGLRPMHKLLGEKPMAALKGD